MESGPDPRRLRGRVFFTWTDCGRKHSNPRRAQRVRRVHWWTVSGGRAAPLRNA